FQAEDGIRDRNVTGVQTCALPILSASVDANGHLTISASGSGNGIAINEMTSSVGSSAEGFSDYFGLNDLITGTSASNIAVRSDKIGRASCRERAEVAVGRVRVTIR